MFSNISDAWDHDPVKEISNKLSNGSFKTNTEYNKIFDFKNRNPGNKIMKSDDVLSLSDVNSLKFISDDNSDCSSFAPINFNKYLKKFPGKSNKNNFNESLENSKCTYGVKHIKKCDKCYDQLKHFINTKVNKKFDELILENKMKQLQNTSHILHQPTPYIQNSTKSDSWKEVLIIVVGAIIAIFIIFLIVKSIYK